MATLAEVARQRTNLTPVQVGHLQQLVAEWGFLADLSFADLLLYVPTPTNDWVVLAQVRPSTARTIYVADYVGDHADTARSLLDNVASSGGLCEGDIDVEGLAEPARMLGIPVRLNGEIIAVLARETTSRNTRMLGELEEQGIHLTEQQLSTIYSPVGLDIGAETSEEIALSILSQIKAVLSGKQGSSLHSHTGTIHSRSESVIEQVSVSEKIIQS